MNEQQFAQTLSQLDSNIQPERDLWPDIAARLEPQHQHKPEYAAAPTATQDKRTGLRHWASAAALVLVTLIGWQLVIAPEPATRATTMPTAELMLLQVYEQQKARQLAQMVAVAEGFDNWQQQLQIWDQAIAQVRQALQIYPDEPQLLAQLQRLYQQQLSYLNQATLQHTLTMG
jgi:hypothetical protein